MSDLETTGQEGDAGGADFSFLKGVTLGQVDVDKDLAPEDPFDAGVEAIPEDTLDTGADFSFLKGVGLGLDDEPPPIRVDHGSLAEMSDDEAAMHLPKRMSVEPSATEIESLHPSLNTDEYYEKRREVALEYNSSSSNDDRIRILSEFTDEWMPAVLERATGKTGWKEKGLTGLATAVQWLDNVTGRPIRALINTVGDDRRQEILQERVDVHSPVDFWRRYKENYERSDASIHGPDNDGERTLKNIHLVTRAMSLRPDNWLMDEVSERWIGGNELSGVPIIGKKMSGAERLAALDAEADTLLQFGAESIADLGYGAGGAMSQALKIMGVSGAPGWAGWSAAREEAAAEGDVGGHEFLGFVGLVATDPLMFFKLPKIAQLGGVYNTKPAAAAIRELVETQTKTFLDEAVAGGRMTAEEAAEALPRYVDDAANRYGMEQLEASNVAFQSEIPNVYGVNTPSLLTDLKNPKLGYVVDDILERSGSTTPSRRPANIETTPSAPGVELDAARAADDLSEQAAMQSRRAEEAWSEIVRESIRRKQIPDGIRLNYKGVDVNTLDDVWDGAVRWVDPVKIGKETAEQAFNRQRLFHKMDNARTKMMLGLIRKYPYLEPIRRTAESIIMLEKAQVLATQRPVGDVARSTLDSLREGINRGSLERTPERIAQMERLSGLAEAPTSTQWATIAPKGTARHGVLHTALFRKLDERNLFRNRQATISAQEASAFFDKMKDLGVSPDTMRLTGMFKELGRHDPATASILEGVGGLDKMDDVLRRAIEGDLKELPAAYRLELETIASERGFLDNYVDAAKKAEEVYIASKGDRKEALKVIRLNMNALRESMKNTLGDVFAREAEIRALKDVEPVRGQIRELMTWRQEFADLIKNKIWVSDRAFHDAISQIDTFRAEQGRAIQKMVSSDTGADLNKVFEGYRREKILPKGTVDEWKQFRDDVHDAAEKTLFKGDDDATALAEAWILLNDTRAKTWAVWHRLPEDHANAWYLNTYQKNRPFVSDIKPENLAQVVENLGKDILFSHKETGKLINFYEAAKALRTKRGNELSGELRELQTSFERLTEESLGLQPKIEALKRRIDTAEGAGSAGIANDLRATHQELLNRGGSISNEIRLAVERSKQLTAELKELHGDKYKLVNRAGEEVDPRILYSHAEGALREGDEIFEFGFNAWNVSKAEKILSESPRDTVSIPIDELPRAGFFVKVDKEYAAGVDLSKPITVVEDPKLGRMIIDGWHRVQKAKDSGAKEIKARLLTKDESASVVLKDDELLYSRAEGAKPTPQAYVHFDKDNKAIIGAFEGIKGPQAFTAMVEEFGHILRRDLPAQDLVVAEKWVTKQLGGKPVYKGHKWSEAAEETFAKAFVKWVKTGKLPSGATNQSALREVFEKTKEWMLDVYYVITGKGRVRGVFEDLSEAEKAVARKRRKSVPEIKITKDIEAVFERLLDPEALRGKYSPLVRELDDSVTAFRASDDPLASAIVFMKVQAAVRDLAMAAGRTSDEADAVLADLVSKDIDKVSRANRSLDRIKMQATGRHKVAPSIESIEGKTLKGKKALENALKEDLVSRLGLRTDEAQDLIDKGLTKAIRDAEAGVFDDVAPIVDDVVPAPKPAAAERRTTAADLERQPSKYDDRPPDETWREYQNDLDSVEQSYKAKIKRARSDAKKQELRHEMAFEKEKFHEEWLGRRVPEDAVAEKPRFKNPKNLAQIKALEKEGVVAELIDHGRKADGPRYTVKLGSGWSHKASDAAKGTASFQFNYMKHAPAAFKKVVRAEPGAARIVTGAPKKLTKWEKLSELYPSILKRMASDYARKHPALANREVKLQDLRRFDSENAVAALNKFETSWGGPSGARAKLLGMAYGGDVVRRPPAEFTAARSDAKEIVRMAYGRNDPRVKGVGTDMNAAIVSTDAAEVARSVKRVDEAVDGARTELARKTKAAESGDSQLQTAADIAAIKPVQVSEETINKAEAAVRWLEGQIADRESFVRSELSRARKDARLVRRTVDGEDVTTELGDAVRLGDEDWRVAGAEGPLKEAMDRLAHPGRPTAPHARIRHKIDDVTEEPNIVAERMSDRMDVLLADMPKTKESIMAAAKQLGYDLRTPGEMWQVILNAKKWSRSYGDELALRREMALEAFRNDEIMRIYQGLDNATKGKIERILKNRKLYGVARNSPPEIKALAKSLGMTGEEELFITLKSGRVRVGDHFSNEEIEQALKAAKLIDTLLEKRLKEMKLQGLFKSEDPLVRAEINMLEAEKTLSRDAAERAKIEGKIKRLTAERLMIEFDKEAFLTRSNIGSYMPHLAKSVSRATTSALQRGGMPSSKKAFFEKHRTTASVLDDINEQKRAIIGKEDLYHNAMEINRPAWAPGAPFHGMDPEAVRAAALKGDLESIFSVDDWVNAVDWSRKNLSGTELYEFFEADLKIMMERYLRESSQRVADARHGNDIDKMFPVGDEIAKLVEGLPVGIAELKAREFGYSRLSKFDSIQSATGIPLPKELKAYESVILDLLKNNAPEEVVGILRDRGVSVDVVHVEAMKGIPSKYAPTPYVEYLRWINKPDWAGGKWWMGWLDGFLSLAKGLATVSSLAHVGMNASGNHVSIAQKLGPGAFNPANHLDAMTIFMKLDPSDEAKFLKHMGVKHEDAAVTLGTQTKSVGEWRTAFDEAGITESPLSKMFLEEMGSIGAGRTSPQIMGSAAGAAALGTAGFLGGGPIGAAALGFIGQYPGALLGEVLSKGFSSEAVKAMGGTKLAKTPEALRTGWKRVWFEEMDEFRKAIDISTKKGVKGSIQYFGERAVGMTASGAIGSVFGPAGAVASAIAGLSLPSYMRMMTGLNQAVETQARITLAVGELRAGKTLEQAALSVDDALRNYSHLTPVEKHVFRRLFFFYTWDAGNMRFQMSQLVKEPRQAAVFGHFMNGVFKGQFNEEEIQSMPENLRWRVMMKTGPSHIWAINGMPQQAFLEMLGRWSDGKPAGLLTRARPDALLLFEMLSDKRSVYYGKGWDELTNVRMLKDSNPFLKKVAGFPVKKDPKTGKWVESPGRRPIFNKDKEIIGWKKDYRAMHPERYYMMTKLPGWRILMEQLKLQKDSFTSTAINYEDPNERATEIQRAMSFITGNRPYSIDFENQMRYMEWRFLDELARQIKLQDKTFFVDIKRAVRRIPPKDGALEIPSDATSPERVAPERAGAGRASPERVGEERF